MAEVFIYFISSPSANTLPEGRNVLGGCNNERFVVRHNLVGCQLLCPSKKTLKCVRYVLESLVKRILQGKHKSQLCTPSSPIEIHVMGLIARGFSIFIPQVTCCTFLERLAPTKVISSFTFTSSMAILSSLKTLARISNILCSQK